MYTGCLTYVTLDSVFLDIATLLDPFSVVDAWMSRAPRWRCVQGTSDARIVAFIAAVAITAAASTIDLMKINNKGECMYLPVAKYPVYVFFTFIVHVFQVS